MQVFCRICLFYCTIYLSAVEQILRLFFGIWNLKNQSFCYRFKHVSATTTHSMSKTPWFNRFLLQSQTIKPPDLARPDFPHRDYTISYFMLILALLFRRGSNMTSGEDTLRGLVTFTNKCVHVRKAGAGCTSPTPKQRRKSDVVK